MKLLICTDGSSSSIQSADLVIKLRFPPNTQITVLGVSENKNDLDSIAASMDMIGKMLGSTYVVDRKIRNGEPIEEIMSEALQTSYDLVAVGGGGGQLGLLHPQLGSTTSILARKVHTHFLVARDVPIEVNKILFCTGAEAPASMTMTLGGEWISSTEAEIGLLHVLPMKSGDKSITDTIAEKNSHDYQEQRDSILPQARQQLRDAGVKTEIKSRIRRGLVVEQVISELKEGNYELLVIGAHYQPGQDRWQGTLLDDVSDQLLNRCTCSVLII
jgi:nucleotide-binding universal stress UspA family protein